MEILLLSIKQETGAREKQNRELELGREVQERPSPQQYPAIPGFDYAGGCRPALGVGGDYCDFTPVANGGLSIAIGDVSGKGIPAALLMTNGEPEWASERRRLPDPARAPRFHAQRLVCSL